MGDCDTFGKDALVLSREEWLPLAQAHAAEVDEICAPVHARRAAGQSHPTEDFMWTYYSLRPSQLRKWHPGFGVALANASEYEGMRGYEVDEVGTARVSASFIEARRTSWTNILNLLRNTAAREPRFGCSALHEWAMVYGLQESEIRHENLPLRLTPDRIAQVVTAAPLRCTHYDAFRFYTSPAKTFNQLQLTRETQPQFEQGGCLHANMDLYKWGYKLLPAISSELLMRCFKLARSGRELDMAASPYDNSDWGLQPIEIEHAHGKAQFIERQRQLAAAAAPLRAELIVALEKVLA